MKKANQVYHSPLKGGFNKKLAGLTILAILSLVGFFVYADVFNSSLLKGFETGETLAYSMNSEEQDMFNRHNQARSANGKPALRFNSNLASYCAKPWSNTMAGDGNLRHNPNYSACVQSQMDPSNTKVVTGGENVGQGPSTADVFAAFMDSPLHKSNILDSDFTDVGIALTTADGTQWWTVNFGAAKPKGGGTPPPPPPKNTKTRDTEKPAAPSLLFGGVTYNTTTLKLYKPSDNVGVIGYDIFRSESGGTFKRIRTYRPPSHINHPVGTVVNYQDKGLKAQTTYTYYVQAFDKAGNRSVNSNQGNFVTPAKPAPKPKQGGLLTKLQDTSFNVPSTMIKNLPFNQSRSIGKWSLFNAEWHSSNVMLVRDPAGAPYFASASQIIDVDPKTKNSYCWFYKASGSARNTDGNNNRYSQRLYVDLLDANFNRIAAKYVPASVQTKWYHVTTSDVEVTPDTKYVRVFIYGPNDANFASTFFWDNISLVLHRNPAC